MDRAHRTRCSLGGARVVGVQHHAVAFLLRGEDALLGARIILEAAVPVEVVGSNVQYDGDRGSKLLRAFKLEAGNLEHRPCFGVALINQADYRDADVAAYQRVQAALLENLAGECCGCCLAVGAGDGQDFALEKARGQFQLADYRAAEVFGLYEFGRIERHAGAHHDQVLSAESEQSMAAGLHHNALFKQRGDVLGQCLGAAHIGDRHLRALAAQKQRRREAGFPQSHYQNLLAFQIQHRYQSPGFRDNSIVHRWARRAPVANAVSAS